MRDLVCIHVCLGVCLYIFISARSMMFPFASEEKKKLHFKYQKLEFWLLFDELNLLLLRTFILLLAEHVAMLLGSH